MPSLQSKPSKAYAHRVQVFAPSGRHLYHVHADEASRMVRDQEAEVQSDPADRKIWRLTLLHVPGSPWRLWDPRIPFSPRKYGHRYSYLATVGHRKDGAPLKTYQLRPIQDEIQRKLLWQALKDCLGKSV